jgi:hypothetical protein
MRYKGATLSATAPVTTGGESGTAPGAWTLEQQAQAQAAGLWPIPPLPKYIEDVFSTYLYTGNDTSGTTTQTITNNIDLSTKGGLVWVKWRSGAVGSGSHVLVDTSRGVNKFISSNSTAAEATQDTVSAFNTTGFTLLGAGGGKTNYSGDLYTSWTFREQPKFFDVINYTGTGSATTIAHALGSVPGCIIVKRTDTSGNWQVYHNGLTSAAYSIQLNLTAAQASAPTIWDSTAPTSSVFSIGTDATVNASGGTYVAYLFASNAGGFGLTGTDNVISCGSYTGTSDFEGPFVNLGFEPQWLLIKSVGSVKNWVVLDNMRGLTADGSNEGYLYPNLSNAEGGPGTLCKISSTGFQASGSSLTAANGISYIYIAIRRGPMKVPTVGTSVFSPVKGTATIPGFITGFPVDMSIFKNYPSGGFDELCTRLLGKTYLTPTNTSAEGADSGAKFDYQNGWYSTLPANTYIGWNFQRAPSFMDVVCYTGNGGYVSRSHNLAAVPEMMIVKARSSAGYNWAVYSSSLGIGSYLKLNTTGAPSTTGDFWYQTPTATQFSTGGYADIDDTGVTYVNYLFATCAGVSKVGSYTGNGTTQTIDCGFTGGARFVLIKRTDSTGDWYVYDTARGMTVLTDPYLLMNTTAAEVATLGSVTTVATGFALNSAITAAINVSAGTYIFLAIA